MDSRFRGNDDEGEVEGVMISLAGSQMVMENEEPVVSSGNNGKTLLIVDDDTVFTSALADGIKIIDEGLTVHTAENGVQAIAIVKSIPVDLVLTDLRMPAMGGSELVLWLNENRPQTPIIVMSAYADTSMVMDLETQGNSFFDKPLDFGDLMRTIHCLLN